MPVSKYKIVKDSWGSRADFQYSYGLGTTPEDLEEGDRILEAMRDNDANRSLQGVEGETESDWVRSNRERCEAGGRSGLKEGTAREGVEEETKSDWVRRNRERYEAGGRSILKEHYALRALKAYGLETETTGDPEMDLIIAMGLRDMEDDPELSHVVNWRETAGSSSNTRETDQPHPPEVEKLKRQIIGSQESTSSSSNAGKAGKAPPGEKRSKRQMKLERQRESAKRFNAQRFSG